MCSCNDYDAPAISERTFPRARKAYQCEECPKRIERGERHANHRWLSEGYWNSARLCLRCERARMALELVTDEGCYSPGMVWECLLTQIPETGRNFRRWRTPVWWAQHCRKEYGDGGAQGMPEPKKSAWMEHLRAAAKGVQRAWRAAGAQLAAEVPAALQRHILLPPDPNRPRCSSCEKYRPVQPKGPQGVLDIGRVCQEHGEFRDPNNYCLAWKGRLEVRDAD